MGQWSPTVSSAHLVKGGAYHSSFAALLARGWLSCYLKYSFQSISSRLPGIVILTTSFVFLLTAISPPYSFSFSDFQLTSLVSCLFFKFLL